MRKLIRLNSAVYFFLLFVFFGNTLSSQVLGDYRSTNTGPWTTLNSWQYYNGSLWVIPTIFQGFPGQFVGTNSVLIQTNHVIGSVSPAFFFGSLTINGQLNLTGNTTTTLKTTTVTINLPGTIFFNNKSKLQLPLNTSLNATTGTLIGDCSNNNSILIDTFEYAVCVGSGSTGQTFSTLMSSGGSLTALSLSNAPVCVGNQIVLTGGFRGNTGYTTANGTLPGVNFSWNITSPSGSIIITNTQNTNVPISESGTYKAVLTCETFFGAIRYTNSVTLFVTPISLSIPTVNILDLTCLTPTSTATFIPQTMGDTYSFDNGDTYQVSNSKSGLIVGNYNLLVKNGQGCISPKRVITIKPLITNIWNGSSWSTNLAPTKDQNIVFNSAFSSTSDLNVCSCKVSSAAVVINSNHILKVTNGITVSGGSLTFENNASLVQINDAAVNSGNIIYKRTTSMLASNYDFVYWGSPVKDQILGTIWMASNWNDTFYNFDSIVNNWVKNSASTIMGAGIGYISRARNGQLGLDYNNVSSIFNIGESWTAKFYGVPNNGIITVPDISSGNFCLLSNPYPSGLDADAFLMENKAVLGGTIYFWTHNTPINNNAYTSNDYASYNGVGGTATSRSLSSGLNTNLPTGKIAAGQAFFATAISSNSVIFKNNMRLDSMGNLLDNSQFFKTNSIKKTENSITKNRVWLNLTNSQGVFKQTLVGYITGATNDLDTSFDGATFDSNTYADFYSINDGVNLTIQGRSLPFDANDVVPLGFKTTINGIFEINIDHVDGLFINHAIYIEDKLTRTITDLKSGNYTFETVSGTFNDRFVLRYANKTLALDSFSAADSQVLVSNKNNQIKINSILQAIEKVFVYDLFGRIVHEKYNIGSTQYSILNLETTNQNLVVKTVLKSGLAFANKIIMRD